MSRSTALNLQEKREIAHKYSTGEFSQTDLASEFFTSRRTVQRALIDMGVISQYNEKKPRLVTAEEEEILARVKRRGLNPPALERALNSPAMTKDNVRLFLSRMEPADFADTLYVVGYLRVQTISKELNDRKQQEAAND